MIGYLIRRVIQAVIVVLGVCLIAFSLYHLIPGGKPPSPGSHPRPEAYHGQSKLFINAERLNKPVWTLRASSLVTSSPSTSGYSYKLNEPRVDHHRRRSCRRRSCCSGLSSLRSRLSSPIPLGIFQVLRRNKPSDYTLTTLSFIFYATPTFFLGIVLIEIFAIHWHLFPPEAPQSASIGGDPRRLARPRPAGDHPRRGLYRRLQPLYALLDDGGAHPGLRPDRESQRPFHKPCQLRACAAQRSHSDHHLVRPHAAGDRRAARSSPSRSSTTRAWASPFSSAAINNDFPLLIGTVVVAAMATVVGSLLADILYAVLDPRIRYV